MYNENDELICESCKKPIESKFFEITIAAAEIQDGETISEKWFSKTVCEYCLLLFTPPTNFEPGEEQ